LNSPIDIDRLLGACGDDSFDDGIRIDADLDPVGGPGAPVKPAVYEGGRYQMDRRWASPGDASPTQVIVIDNVPSQANRLEAAIQVVRPDLEVPEFVLDLSACGELPAHLPRSISSWQFPHRNGDAYLRDSQIDGTNFDKSDIGKAIFAATPWDAGALIDWFPQALVYGFWQSHLGKKRANTKHARAWVSEIIGWNPASTDVKLFGVKGDPLNLTTDETVVSNSDDRVQWGFEKSDVEGGGKDRLSEMGHGQVISDSTPAAVSFSRITQRATLSFAQLRRVSLGGDSDADAAARALLTALSLHAHMLAFGRGFALRSGAELRLSGSVVTWLGSGGDEILEGLDHSATAALLQAARDSAVAAGISLAGWKRDAVILTPKDNLRKAISATWPELGAEDSV